MKKGILLTVLYLTSIQIQAFEPLELSVPKEFHYKLTDASTISNQNNELTYSSVNEKGSANYTNTQNVPVMDSTDLGLSPGWVNKKQNGIIQPMASREAGGSAFSLHQQSYAQLHNLAKEKK